MKGNTALIAIAAAVAFFGLTSGRDGGSSGLVHQAFETYEAEWRKTNGQAADKLDAGEFKDEASARDWIESQQKNIRRKAFGDIASFEQEKLGNGQWTEAKHAEVLRGWERGQ